MKQIFLLLAKRLKSKIPKRYKYVAWAAGVIGLAAMTLPSLPISLPIIVVATLPTIEALCAIIVGTALFKTEDENLIKETDRLVKQAKNTIKNINTNIKK